MSVRNILMAAGGSADDKLYADDVFSAYTYTGNSSTQTINNGIDLAGEGGLVWLKARELPNSHHLFDTIRGGNQYLSTDDTHAQIDRTPSITSWNQNGFSVAGNDWSISYPGYNYISWTFRRAPGFFDVVCRSGTGTSTFTRVDVNHSLGAVPELIIYKCRSNESGWIVGTFNPSSPTSNGYGQLNQTYEIDSASFPCNFLYAAPTATQFSFWDANSIGLDTSGHTYVAYLFASLPGISKVGSYTGNGSSQMINCGFSTGARFILIKRTDSTGDWYVWDTARGIVAANDPHLSLNTTAAEVTTNDSVDPDANGFIVNQVAATNVNVTGATYLYLAIA